MTENEITAEIGREIAAYEKTFREAFLKAHEAGLPISVCELLAWQTMLEAYGPSAAEPPSLDERIKELSYAGAKIGDRFSIRTPLRWSPELFQQ